MAETPLVSVQQIINAVYDPTTIALKTEPAGFSYTNISTSAQTAVKTSPGVLGSVVINSTLTSAVRLYDNVVSGGTQIATIPAATTGRTFDYNLRFVSGLVVSSGAAADNITIIYN